MHLIFSFVITIFYGDTIFSYCLEHDRKEYRWFRFGAKENNDLTEIIEHAQKSRLQIDPDYPHVLLVKSIPSIRAKIANNMVSRF